MIDEATLAKAIERTKDVIEHCEGLRIEKAAGQNVVRTMFHRDADIRILIAAARERDGLRAELGLRARLLEQSRERRVRLEAELSEVRTTNELLIAEKRDLRTALESQRQATEEAMRRAEEARRELADWKNCKPAQVAR